MRHAVPAAGALAALAGAAPAFADKIDDAAVKLSEATYPFLKEVPWNADYYAKIPSASPAADLKAIGSVDGNGVTSLADYTEINKALGHMIASAGVDKTMAVYNAFGALVPKDVPAYLMGTVNSGDAQAAYKALMEFKDVVKASR